jgi:predicted transcriptional regulator
MKAGYQYTYKIKPRQEIKEIVMKIVENWKSRVESEFNKWI